MSKDEALESAIETLKDIFKHLEPYSTYWIGVQATILLCESALENKDELSV